MRIYIEFYPSMHRQSNIKIPEKKRSETSRSLHQIQDGYPVTDNQQEIVEIISLSKPENPEFEKNYPQVTKITEKWARGDSNS